MFDLRTRLNLNLILLDQRALIGEESSVRLVLCGSLPAYCSSALTRQVGTPFVATVLGCQKRGINPQSQQEDGPTAKIQK